MKPLKPKATILTLACLSILLILSIAVYMYSAYDVGELTDHYPQAMVKKNTADYIIKPGKPAKWVELKSISPAARWAIVISEDWAFYQHAGLDVEQIKVVLSEMAGGERFRGASTITQQTVKNIYLTHQRSLWRKLHEIILARKLEKNLSKDRILEIYLNCIQYGPGLFGIGPASRHYFDKAPAELSAREGAFLAMLLPSPNKYYTSFKQRQLTAFARERIKAVLTKMRMAKVITPEEFELQLETPFSWEKRAAESSADDVPETFIGNGSSDIREIK